MAVTVVAILTSRLTWGGLLPNYYTTLGANDAQIGIAFSLTAAALALFQLVGGLLADRVGRKPIAVLPVFAVVFAVACMAMAQNWQALLAGHLAFSVFASAQSPAFTTLVAESVPPGERGRAFSVISVSAGIASAVGPALGAALLIVTSNRLPPLLWGTVAVATVVSTVRLFLLKETSDSNPASSSLRLALKAVNWNAAGRFLLIGALYATVNNLVLNGPFVALHARDILGLNSVELNLLLAAGNGAAIVAALSGGWFADRVGRRPALFVGLTLMTACTLAWALAPRGVFSTTCFLLATAGNPIAHIAYNSLLTGVVEGRHRGAFVGLAGTITGLLGSPASRIGAELRARGSSDAPFWAAMILAGVLALVLVIDSLRARREHKS